MSAADFDQLQFPRQADAQADILRVGAAVVLELDLRCQPVADRHDSGAADGFDLEFRSPDHIDIGLHRGRAASRSGGGDTCLLGSRRTGHQFAADRRFRTRRQCSEIPEDRALNRIKASAVRGFDEIHSGRNDFGDAHVLDRRIPLVLHVVGELHGPVDIDLGLTGTSQHQLFAHDFNRRFEFLADAGIAGQDRAVCRPSGFHRSDTQHDLAGFIGGEPADRTFDVGRGLVLQARRNEVSHRDVRCRSRAGVFQQERQLDGFTHPYLTRGLHVERQLRGRDEDLGGDLGRKADPRHAANRSLLVGDDADRNLLLFIRLQRSDPPDQPLVDHLGPRSRSAQFGSLGDAVFNQHLMRVGIANVLDDDRVDQRFAKRRLLGSDLFDRHPCLLNPAR